MFKVWKKLTIWAARNPRTARFIIAISWILNAFIGLVIGKMLTDLGIFLGRPWMYITAGLMILGFAVYPSKELLKQEAMFFESVYKRKGIAHALIFFGFMFFMVTLPANRDYLKEHSMILGKKLFAIEYKAKNLEQINEPFTVTQAQSKNPWILIKPAKPNISILGRILLIIFYLAVAGLIAAVVWIAACAASCGGNDTLAFVIFVLGAVIELFVFYLIIKQIIGIIKDLKAKGAEKLAE